MTTAPANSIVINTHRDRRMLIPLVRVDCNSLAARCDRAAGATELHRFLKCKTRTLTAARGRLFPHRASCGNQPVALTPGGTRLLQLAHQPLGQVGRREPEV